MVTVGLVKFKAFIRQDMADCLDFCAFSDERHKPNRGAFVFAGSGSRFLRVLRSLRKIGDPVNPVGLKFFYTSKMTPKIEVNEERFCWARFVNPLSPT